MDVYKLKKDNIMVLLSTEKCKEMDNLSGKMARFIKVHLKMESFMDVELFTIQESKKLQENGLMERIKNLKK